MGAFAALTKYFSEDSVAEIEWRLQKKVFADSWKGFSFEINLPPQFETIFGRN